MQREAIKWQRRFGNLVMALAASLSLGGCGDTTSADGVQDTQATRTIYWTDVDSTGTKTLVRSATITEAQARWVIDARLHDGQQGATRPPPGLDGVTAQVTSAVTSTSTDWAVCSQTNWFLVTSGSGGSGNIFCGRYAAPLNPITGVQMPFLPAWYRAASTGAAIYSICKSSNNCTYFDCCPVDGGCGDLWHTYFWYDGSGDISPPANAQYLASQNFPGPC